MLEKQLPIASEILPNLYISGTMDDDVIQRANTTPWNLTSPFFESLVCTYVYANPSGPYVREQRFGIADAELDEAIKPELLRLADWLHAEWKLGKRVAAKCQAGLNRSALIAALVLLKEGFSAEEAIKLIREKRSEYALFNESFVSFIFEVFQRVPKEGTLSA